MTKWEYTCLSAPEQGDSSHFEDFLAAVNKLGSEGWEAFSIVQRFSGATGRGGFGELASAGLTVFLKRATDERART